MIKQRPQPMRWDIWEWMFPGGEKTAGKNG